MATKKKKSRVNEAGNYTKPAMRERTKAEYAATTRKKRKDTAAGRQHSAQPRRIAKKTATSRTRNA